MIPVAVGIQMVSIAESVLMLVVKSVGYGSRWGKIMKQKESVAQARESIKLLRTILATHQWEPARKHLEFAIQEVSKCIPARPIRERWNPNRCPNCGADLGGECDDGYYQNPWFESCPECRQILDYE